MFKQVLKKISLVLFLVILITGSIRAQVKNHKRVFKKKSDLVVTRIISQERTVESGSVLKYVEINIKNVGSAKAIGTQSNASGGYFVDIVLGPAGGRPAIKLARFSEVYKKYCMLKGGRIGNTPDLAPGQSHRIKLRNYLKLPKNTPEGMFGLFAIVDPGNKINERNNVNQCIVKITRKKPVIKPYRFRIDGIKRIATEPYLVRFQVQYYIDPSYPKACFIGVKVPSSSAPNYNFSFVPAGRLPNGVPKGQKHFTNNIFITLNYNGSTPYTSNKLEVMIYEKDGRTLKRQLINWGQTWDANIH